MTGERDSPLVANNAEYGLCASCLHARQIESARGSRFILCRLSETDLRFRKYPHLPVVACDGHASRQSSHQHR